MVEKAGEEKGKPAKFLQGQRGLPAVLGSGMEDDRLHYLSALASNPAPQKPFSYSDTYD